jgi:hypothetical protein
MTREMLKEAIADAKTIKETAIASAKSALEEAFTPQLTAMFAERLNELELEEEAEETDETMYETHSKGEEDENLEEDFNLEELLAELSKEDNEEETTDEGMDKESLEEDLMLEDMSDEEIEELVMQVIDDMIASGKLMPGEGEEEDEEGEDMEEPEMGDESDMEAEEEEIDEDINLEELLAEIEDDKEEKSHIDETLDPEILKMGMEFLALFKDPSQWTVMSEKAATFLARPEGAGVVLGILTIVGSIPFLGPAIKAFFKKTEAKAQAKIDSLSPEEKAKAEQAKKDAEAAFKNKIVKEDKEKDKETEETIKELRNELNEVNLLNAKLLYTNKIFKSKSLTESEKIKVLNTFDKAETVKEVKLVYETLTESLKTTTVAKKNTIKESLGSASKTISTATPKQPIIESNEAFARMQKLAGLRK